MLVPRKKGSPCFCVDYRKLIDCRYSPSYLPYPAKWQMCRLFEQCKGFLSTSSQRWILADKYGQLRLRKTALVTRYSYFETKKAFWTKEWLRNASTFYDGLRLHGEARIRFGIFWLRRCIFTKAVASCWMNHYCFKIDEERWAYPETEDNFLFYGT